MCIRDSPSSNPNPAALRQDFSHYGLLAVFLTMRYRVEVESVSSSEDGALTIQIRTIPQPPLPTCSPGACPTIPPPSPPVPWYLLIAIRKGSLTAPLQRLYIAETPNVDQPSPPLSVVLPVVVDTSSTPRPCPPDEEQSRH